MRFTSSFFFFNVCYLIRYQGHAFAKELAARGLQTTVITDSAVFAMISRVNMVCGDCIGLFVLFFLFAFDWESPSIKGYSGSTCCHG